MNHQILDRRIEDSYEQCPIFVVQASVHVHVPVDSLPIREKTTTKIEIG